MILVESSLHEVRFNQGEVRVTHKSDYSLFNYRPLSEARQTDATEPVAYWLVVNDVIWVGSTHPLLECILVLYIFLLIIRVLLNMPLADPGFLPPPPPGGGGRQDTILPIFPENCMNSKEFGRPWGGVSAPPWIRKCMHSHTIDNNAHSAVQIKFIQLS